MKRITCEERLWMISSPAHPRRRSSRIGCRRSTNIERDLAAQKAAEQQAALRREKIAQNLSTARLADTADKAKDALPLLDEVLRLDPNNSEARGLRQQLQALLTPKEFVNSLGMKLVHIEAGIFLMGSPPTEQERSGDETQHRVTLTKPFFMATTAVTQSRMDRPDGHNPPPATRQVESPILNLRRRR